MECECGRAIIVRLIGSPDSLGLIIFAFVVAGRLSYDSLGVQIAWDLLFLRLCGWAIIVRLIGSPDSLGLIICIISVCECGWAIIVRLIGSPDSLGLIISECECGIERNYNRRLITARSTIQQLTIFNRFNA